MGRIILLLGMSLYWVLAVNAPLHAADAGADTAERVTMQTAAADETSAVEATGQPPRSSDQVFPLPQFVAKGKEVSAPPTLTVKEVTPEDISAWNAHNVGDALTWVPGINVQIGGSSADSRAWIRGFRDRDALVLFDGIPIASGFEGTIDLNEITTNSLAGIKVIMVAPSVIYGTNGVAGVIDVLPQTEIYDSYVDGAVELGSDDRRLIRASAGGGDGNVSYGLAAQHQEGDDYSLSDDYVPQLFQPGDTRVNSDFDRDNLFFHLGARETFIGNASMFFGFSDAEKGLLPQAGIEDPDFERLTKSQRQTVGLSNHFNGVPLSLKLYYNSYDSEVTAFTDETYSEIDEIVTAEDYSYGGKLYSTIDTGPNNTLVLTGGAQTDVYKTNDELEVGNRAELTTWTVAAEDQFWMTDRLSLAAGLIYVYFDQTLLDKTLDEINPQIALAWQANRAWSFHGAAAQRTRFPKLRELYRDRYGNPDLGVQTANNYEIGLTWRDDAGISADVVLFRSDIDGLIERPNRQTTYLNLDETTIQGVEAGIGGWLTDRVFARFAYTYVDAEETLPDGGTRQLRSRPKNTALLELRYRFLRDVLLSFNSIYVSGLYDLDDDDVYTEIDSFFVGHAKLLWPITPQLAAYLSVSNIADTDYEHRLGNPREGRWAAVGVTFDF